MQREVLSLYRKALRRVSRVCRDDSRTKAHMLLRVRREFEERRNIDKKNFSRIEYLLRKGNKQVELLLSETVTSMSLWRL